MGLVLAHGRQQGDWKSPLLTTLAERLASQGFVVARVASASGESTERSAALYEKVLDACATSPYAQAVKRWILAGVNRERDPHKYAMHLCSSQPCISSFDTSSGSAEVRELAAQMNIMVKTWELI